MGYRRLLRKYMQHLQQRSGTTWLVEKLLQDVSDMKDFADSVDQNGLSARDLGELRSLWTTLERQSSLEAEGDLNERTQTLCIKHGLTSAELALYLGWNQHIIDEWLLPPQDPSHQRMLRRDFEHLMSCISPVIGGSSPNTRRREASP